jgi:hypothetical protein
VAGEVLATAVTYGPMAELTSTGAVSAPDGTPTQVRVLVTAAPKG